MSPRRSKSKPFDPDWVVPTSEMLRECLADLGLSTRVAVACVPKDQREEATKALDAVLNEDAPVTVNTANLLAACTMTTPYFWLAFEHNYREGLAAGKHVIGEGKA